MNPSNLSISPLTQPSSEVSITGQLIRSVPGKQILAPHERILLIHKIACFEQPKSIIRWAKEELGKRLTSDLIHSYKNTEKWKPLISKFRQEYLQSITEIPIANKIKRVEKLENMLDRTEKLEEKSKGKNRLEAIDRQMKVLSEARQEMDVKDKEGTQNFYFTQFNNMTPQEFEEYRLKLVEKIKYIKLGGTQDAGQI